MPIYEYACTACGERVEARQSFTDPPLEDCDICGGKLRKLYSPVGIVFKGSGFYATDGKNAKKGDNSTSGSDAGSGSDKKTESKTQTKEAKTETTPTSSAPSPKKDQPK